MTLLRRFLVIQALMLWQGGFVFYAAFVVPVGTEVLSGSLEQGRITRFVAATMNLIGAFALLVFAWELLHGTVLRRRIGIWLWASWTVMAACLVALFLLYPRMNELIDFDKQRHLDRDRFYLLHSIYLYISTFQWVASLVFAAALLHSWRVTDRSSS